MEKVSVLGLGYVGLPLFVGLTKFYPNIVGFDIDSKRISALKSAHDWTGEMTNVQLKGINGVLSDNLDDMLGTSLFIVTVPT